MGAVPPLLTLTNKYNDMPGNNNFNFFGPSQDPLLSPDYMDSQINKLIEIRDQMRQQQVQAQNSQQPAPKTVWDEIREELNSLTDAQKDILFKDDEYKQCDEEIAFIAARYQMSLLMPYVLDDVDGNVCISKGPREIM